MNKGRVYLVGAGCGDYDLITLRGLELIKKCDVLIYDSLVDKELLEYAENAEKICVGKRSGAHSETQKTINSLLIEKARENKTVVRLKGGDPFVFGRGGEEVIALKEGDIPFDIVPGISSAIAVPEFAGIPVTHRCTSRSFHVITGHTANDVLPENMKAYAECGGTLIFLMGLKNLPKIVHSLIENGMSENTPIAIISNGAYAKNQTVRATLKNICNVAENSEIKPPVVIAVGKTVEYDFSPTIKKPLEDISVTVTGTQRLSSKLSKQLSANGADINHMNHLNIIEYRNNPKFDKALNDIEKYSYIVLTSMNGAEIFINKLKALKIDIRKLVNIKFAVIGMGTASVLEKYGIFAELIPNDFTSEALGKLLVKKVHSDERLLILRAEKGSLLLTGILDKNNIQYDDIKTYGVQLDYKTEANKTIDTDFIAFASSSGVDAFYEGGFTISPKTKIVCIGEITAETLIKHGVSGFNISKTKTVEGITDTILKIVEENSNEKI